MNHLQPRLSPNSIAYQHFHKTLPLGENLRVGANAWKALRDACLSGTTSISTIENIPGGKLPPGNPPSDQSNFRSASTATVAAPFVSPMAAWSATDGFAAQPEDIAMPAPPSITSKAIAAEMNELYWMARLRDVPITDLGQQAQQSGAIDDINNGYNAAIANGETEIVTYRDIPLAQGKSAFTKDTIFRAGLPGENVGPMVSQFFLQPINYGAQLILPTQIPYKPGQNYLLTMGDWLLAQNTGLDTDGDAYNHDNDFSKEPGDFELTPGPDGKPMRYYIRTMRDLCRFVNRDALHQAYFNAGLLLNGWGAKPTPGNTLNGKMRQIGFATLGGPDILALISWVACDALRTVWHQKWRLWLRLRPEAFGGLASIAPKELGDAYGALTGLNGHNGTGAEKLLLPVAFSAGSPAHPSYGAGHASVAGACVTLLKAWYAGDTLISKLIANSGVDPVAGFNTIKAAGAPMANGEPPDYTGADGASLTVEGELNKLASNVAMGRSMGGVHFRTDNTRSLGLGELVTTFWLSNFVNTYREAPTFAFNSFDGAKVSISQAGVSVDGVNGLSGDDLVQRYNANGHI